MKKILLCVTGGIAAYKAATIASQLYQLGFEVKVMMSESSQKFITPLTLQTLSRNEVYTDTFEERNPKVVAHIDLADWADLAVVAPATANCIGKLANGIADDMITTTLLATTAPIMIAPAMNVNMYQHPAVQANMQKLADYGYRFVEPGEGLLACGYIGKGRLAEPEEIIACIKDFSAGQMDLPLEGKKVLITAGPTREQVDPVRYFTNYSSGKMGYAIARTAAEMGASVTLVSGPTALEKPAGVKFISVESTDEMFHAVMKEYPEMDLVIKSAAVADYTPRIKYGEKVKKKNENWSVEMEKTTDILSVLGEKKERQVLVGFAAETGNLEGYALDKLKRKNLDMIVANNVAQEGAGFSVDTNRVVIYKKDGSAKEYPLLSKDKVAQEVLAQAMELMPL
ncbi:bifunctional phosphopantothenoylcysteine decarboxylase/phosphopantothenate--cysteine ligase CoaBC [Fictibacillus sp. KU28468]|uniref:bifunctional phosphopantothenoylcysteine decarboxylase/phosphopantothenate--cysteine ligase CoaBC n=1 Tax=Fictibacillus sp. KU28468 TaxID=2991053 RepID=UPI00223C8E05|nr:bifunctional phosphopantothenoylcysteine decarboxylase/phosphopantothenate--cysteine ligase CoaBC [Fictibacillus sp. KU28468]UZJ81127.1 bifunctional phosphopantothenoylcysteine decarboxylase/phosphopantothenate--cysteine ligase CoaBC [Fictibacillus sp. KU28468]